MPATTHDIFEPPFEPAKSIYLAFQAAAKTRLGPVEEWTEKECQVVLNAATEQAKKLKIEPPTIEMVKRAENYARGSVDYGAKWAYRLTQLMGI